MENQVLREEIYNLENYGEFLDVLSKIHKSKFNDRIDLVLSDGEKYNFYILDKSIEHLKRIYKSIFKNKELFVYKEEFKLYMEYHKYKKPKLWLYIPFYKYSKDKNKILKGYIKLRIYYYFYQEKEFDRGFKKFPKGFSIVKI